MKLRIMLEKQIRDETNTLTTWLVQIKVIKMPRIMDVCPCALQAQEHGIYPISAEGWQIAYTCMTPVQDMNGLEGGPAMVVSSRLVGHAHVYVFIPHRLHTTRVRGRGGVVMVVVIEFGMCGGLFFGWVAAGLCGSLRVWMSSEAVSQTDSGQR